MAQLVVGLGLVGGGCGRRSVSNVVGGRCFPFLLVGGRWSVS